MELTSNASTDKIPIEQFSQMDLRIGRITGVEEVINKDRLYKLSIDLGENTPRTILAGIKPWYSKEELIDRQVVALVNLEPKTIAGIESQGMLLAADQNGDCILLKPDKEVMAGTRVR